MSDDFIEDLKQAHDSLLSEKIEIQERLSKLELIIELIDKALEVASISDEMRKQTRSIFDRLQTDHLSKMTLEDALVHYARTNEGILNSYQVRPLLVEAGLLKGSPGVVSSRLYEALSNSEYFEQLQGGRKGRWRLVTYDIDGDDSPI